MRLAKWAKLFAMNARNPGVSKDNVHCLHYIININDRVTSCGHAIYRKLGDVNMHLTSKLTVKD